MAFNTFGDYLRKNREKFGITQVELAEKAKLDRTYVSMIENRGNPAFTRILEIASAIGVSLEEFFSEDKETQKPTILFQSDLTQLKKSSEHNIKANVFPIPILTQTRPFKTRVIEDEDVSGYLAFDQALLPHKGRVVAWNQNVPKDVRFVLIALDNIELKSGQVFFFEIDDQFLLKRLIDGNGGSVLCSPFKNHDESPVVLTIKRREALKAYGQLVGYCLTPA